MIPRFLNRRRDGGGGGSNILDRKKERRRLFQRTTGKGGGTIRVTDKTKDAGTMGGPNFNRNTEHPNRNKNMDCEREKENNRTAEVKLLKSTNRKSGACRLFLTTFRKHRGENQTANWFRNT